MKLRNKTIRVFLSSTFEDLMMERDALQQMAFKNLREYCREKEWQFQAVDLRWGINNEATIDQRTMEICLREITRCQEQSPRPNFIVLLGERYGWRPLPDNILQSVALAMDKVIPDDIKYLFKQSYELDENQLPEPVWKLKAREGRYIDYIEYDKKVQKPLVDFFTVWAAENLPDPELPENRDNPLALQRLSMERSATEQEIHAGAFKVEDAKEHVFAFFRNIPECPKENYIWLDSDQCPIQRLRSNLKSYLHEDNVSEFTAAWNEQDNKPDIAHLKAFSENVENCLKAIIDKEIENFKNANEDDLEQSAHDAFATERTFGFSGREKDIVSICDYSCSNQNFPFVVWGASGTGKSTLIAMAARKVQEIMPNAHVITRFIGVTGKSANGHSLLTDLSRNLCKHYGGVLDEIPNDPAKLQYAFHQYLAKATEEKPLILFLDALDQFNEGDTACMLQWLPEVLPPNVKLITSTLKGLSFDVLMKRKEQNPFFNEITPLTSDDGKYALNIWLKGANRTLQTHQIEQVIKDFEYAGCVPLYLRLAFEQAQHWKSLSKKQRLGRDIPEMIEEFYENLSRPESHGPIIVEKILTAIRCSKQGLSDDEILGILAADDEFWNNFGIQTYHTFDNREKNKSTTRLIPPVLWIRLYHDLEYYLTRRNVPGGEVITFYHRQLAEAVDNIYLLGQRIRQKRHKELADFFAGKRLFIKQTAPITANVRVCDELPWLLLKSEDWDRVIDTLCNLDFIQAKASAKMTYELVKDFNDVLESIPDNEENICEEKIRQARIDHYIHDLFATAKGDILIDEIQILKSVTPFTEEQVDYEIKRIKSNPNRLDNLNSYYNFLGQEAANLQNYSSDFPNFSTQQAWNFTNGGPVGIAAENRYTYSKKSLLLISPSARFAWNPNPQVIKTLNGHSTYVTSIAITPDGKQAISGSYDKTCILWDLTTGKAIKILNGHSSFVNTVAITPDGKKAISGSDDSTCILWDLTSGLPIKTLSGHSSYVNSVEITPDGKQAISGSYDKTCILWDLTTGKPIKVLNGHSFSVTSVAITPDGKQAFSGSLDMTCILWDLTTGKLIRTFKGHSGKIWAIAITPDGKQAISASDDKTCILWNLTTGLPIKTLKGHTGTIWAVAITPDGNKAISGSNDRTCILWDLTSGLPIKTLYGHASSVNAVAITPDGYRAVSGSWDFNCILWNLTRGKSIKIINELFEGRLFLAITPDGKQAFSGSKDMTCILWDLTTGKLIRTFKGHSGIVKAIAFTPDGYHAISGSEDKTCILWDLTTGKLVRTFEGHTGTISAVTITPDGKQAFSGSSDKTCILWDLTTGKLVRTFEGHSDTISAVTITPDGKQAFSGSSDKTCILWDLTTGKLIRTFKGHSGKIWAIAITPDGKQAISASNDKTCILWNLTTGLPIKTLSGHSDWVLDIAITPDGKSAVSTSRDKSCILWDIYTGRQLARFVTESPIYYVVCYSGENILINCLSREVIILNAGKDLLCPGHGVVTIRQIWNFELHQNNEFSADCPLCRHHFSPPTSVLSIIEEIKKKARLRPEQSPCQELPKSAWEEPGLLDNCPKCGAQLKFNPFIT